MKPLHSQGQLSACSSCTPPGNPPPPSRPRCTLCFGRPALLALARRCTKVPATRPAALPTGLPLWSRCPLVHLHQLACSPLWARGQAGAGSPLAPPLDHDQQPKKSLLFARGMEETTALRRPNLVALSDLLGLLLGLGLDVIDVSHHVEGRLLYTSKERRERRGERVSEVGGERRVGPGAGEAEAGRGAVGRCRGSGTARPPAHPPARGQSIQLTGRLSCCPARISLKDLIVSLRETRRPSIPVKTSATANGCDMNL